MAHEATPDDVFKILVATDIHLGYEEKHPARGDDSFNTFEEILQIGQENDVDFILLGGDLFHDTKPSSMCMHRCMDLLRQYCMGDRPISVEFISNQKKNFENASQKVVNYEDPNINVSVPVFSIHGNHDDPTGQHAVCSLDILSCAGLVNFFGKTSDYNHVQVNPLLLKKGESRLAIYGFGHIKDPRLYRLFEAEEVSFLRPDEHPDDWFNLCVLHQNRALNRGTKNTIPEDFLPGFLDLVIWGHEHPCRIDPEINAMRNFYVSQPGSSVATSLCEGEAIAKKVGLLNIYKREFRMEAIQLQTVRPFIFRDVCASDYDLDNPAIEPSEQLDGLIQDEVNNMIEEAKTLLTGHAKQPQLPLIRLNLFYSDENQMFNTVRFGQKFEEKVANSDSMIKLLKRSLTREKRDVLETGVMDRVLQGANVWNVRVEDYVRRYFQNVEDESLSMNVLTVSGLNEAVTQMVDSQFSGAMEEIVKYQCERMQKHLMTLDVNRDNIDDEISNYNRQRIDAGDAETQESRTQLEAQKNSAPAGRAAAGRASVSKGNDDDLEDIVIEAPDEDDVEFVDEPVGRGRGRGRARAPRAARASARAPRAPRAARAPRGGRASTASPASGRGRARGAPQRTLQESFATQASQISVVRTPGRANSSRMQFVDSDDE